MSVSLLQGTCHRVPPYMRTILIATDERRLLWQSLTPLARNEWICWVTSAVHLQTKQKRLRVMEDMLAQGKRRPCCWAGCPHRGVGYTSGQGVK